MRKYSPLFVTKGNMKFEFIYDEIKELREKYKELSLKKELDTGLDVKLEFAQCAYELGLLIADQEMMTQANNIWEAAGDTEKAQLAKEAMVLVQIK